MNRNSSYCKMKKEEIWAPIAGYEGRYEVSSYGRIKSICAFKNLTREIFSFGSVEPHGYRIITLTLNGEKRRFYIHRLVALAFIPNPDNLPCINHIDENKGNNHIENLEWCTYKYNSNYGTCTERRSAKRRMEICCFTENGTLVKTYNSMREAVEKEGVDWSSLSGCCKGKFTSCNKKIWLLKKDIHLLPKRIEKYHQVEHPKPVRIVSETGCIIGEYDSFRDAERKTGVCRKSMNKFINKGFFFSKALKERVKIETSNSGGQTVLEEKHFKLI